VWWVRHRQIHMWQYMTHMAHICICYMYNRCVIYTYICTRDTSYTWHIWHISVYMYNRCVIYTYICTTDTSYTHIYAQQICYIHIYVYKRYVIYMTHMAHICIYYMYNRCVIYTYICTRDTSYTWHIYMTHMAHICIYAQQICYIHTYIYNRYVIYTYICTRDMLYTHIYVQQICHQHDIHDTHTPYCICSVKSSFSNLNR